MAKNIRNAFNNLKIKFPDLSVGGVHINNIVGGSLCLLYAYRKQHDPEVYIQGFVRGVNTASLCLELI